MQNDNLSKIKGILTTYFSQEHLVEISSQTTCQGAISVVRLESPANIHTRQRELICLVGFNGSKIVIFAKNINTGPVIQAMRAIKYHLAQLDQSQSPYCIILSECQITCENCLFAKDYYS